MHRNSTIGSAYSADRRNHWERPSGYDRRASEVGSELSRRTSAVVILLLSAGLWGAIYVAVASLARAALW